MLLPGIRKPLSFFIFNEVVSTNHKFARLKRMQNCFIFCSFVCLLLCLKAFAQAGFQNNTVVRTTTISTNVGKNIRLMLLTLFSKIEHYTSQVPGKITFQAYKLHHSLTIRQNYRNIILSVLPLWSFCLSAGALEAKAISSWAQSRSWIRQHSRLTPISQLHLWGQYRKNLDSKRRQGWQTFYRVWNSMNLLSWKVNSRILSTSFRKA